ncbi:hypothetical protein MMC30_002876 [Trapelia coarctata]|nr:hypothetical protein [Trapelia coarctata]
MSSNVLEEFKSPSTDTVGDDLTEPPNTFAYLTPRNAHAHRTFSSVVDAILDNPHQFEHHRKLIDFNISRVSLQSLLRRSNSPSGTVTDTGTDTEPDISASNSDDKVWSGRYLLSLKPPPTLPATGWRAGAGRWTKDDPSGAVDFLLSYNTPQSGVRGSHVYFTFDKETGILMLQARSQRQGVRLESSYFERQHGARALNKSSSIIQIADLEYEFAYTMQPGTGLESAFQSLKTEFFRRHFNVSAPIEATSATPSHNDMSVGDWTLLGAVGLGAFGVVSAASHRKGEVVAFKQLLRHNSATAEAVAGEVSSAQEIKTAIDTHMYKQYVIQLKDVIYQRTQTEYNGSVPEQIFILYTPLARGTFQSHILAEKTDPPSPTIRIALFT